MNRSTFAAVLIASVVMSSCIGAHRTSKVQIGMKRYDVIHRLGSPGEVNKTTEKETLTYYYFSPTYDRYVPYDIDLIEGKVVKKGFGEGLSWIKFMHHRNDRKDSD